MRRAALGLLRTVDNNGAWMRHPDYLRARRYAATLEGDCGRGYVRGLRRAFYGELFDLPADHYEMLRRPIYRRGYEAGLRGGRLK